MTTSLCNARQQVQRDAQDAELRKEQQRHEENMKHNVDLRGQISANMEKRERDRQQFLEDGAKQRCDRLIFFVMRVASSSFFLIIFFMRVACPSSEVRKVFHALNTCSLLTEYKCVTKCDTN